MVFHGQRQQPAGNGATGTRRSAPPRRRQIATGFATAPPAGRQPVSLPDSRATPATPSIAGPTSVRRSTCPTLRRCAAPAAAYRSAIADGAGQPGDKATASQSSGPENILHAAQQQHDKRSRESDMQTRDSHQMGSARVLHQDLYLRRQRQPLPIPNPNITARRG